MIFSFAPSFIQLNVNHFKVFLATTIADNQHTAVA